MDWSLDMENTTYRRYKTALHTKDRLLMLQPKTWHKAKIPIVKPNFLDRLNKIAICASDKENYIYKNICPFKILSEKNG